MSTQNRARSKRTAYVRITAHAGLKAGCSLKGRPTFMARYPQRMESNNTPDAGEDLDLVTVFQSAGSGAEMEALDVKAMLESNDIPVVLVGDTRFPNLPEEVRVPRDHAQQAEQLIADALAAGPAGADEAEAASENP